MRIFGLLVIQPVFEMCIHRLLHKYHFSLHMNHHKCSSDGNFENIGIEYWALFIFSLLFYFRFTFLGLCVLKYWIIHQSIHRFPRAFPRLSHYHRVHHEKTSTNFWISKYFPLTI